MLKISLIKPPSLQELCQGKRTDKVKERPGQANADVEFLSGGKGEQGRKSYDDHAQDVNTHCAVRNGGSVPYPVKAKKGQKVKVLVKKSSLSGSIPCEIIEVVK